jgi:hypothetical protein
VQTRLEKWNADGRIAGPALFNSSAGVHRLRVGRALLIRRGEKA